MSIILVTPPEISQVDLLKTPLDLARELHAKEASAARAQVLEALAAAKQQLDGETVDTIHMVRWRSAAHGGLQRRG